MAERAPPALRVTIGIADFRRLCAGQPVRLISLAERPIELQLDGVGVIAALKAVLDGMTRGEHVLDPPKAPIGGVHAGEAADG